ncbi:47_t:CDS:2 [Dentiscutata erythropus]|uniref:47_t:CDS:1 n=1 Tax=Dentiscutata erythropus TaxID=1348616 RepID=A0A9N9HJB7_9GLOM|nr:47_t:CDS:2 [Dentiscutata erythropus]
MSSMVPQHMEIELTHEDILRFLHQKQNQDVEGSKKFLEYGSSYLLACYKDNIPAHWLCSEEFVEITTELLHLFSLNYTNEQVEEFKNVMADQLSNCVDCVEIYYIYKEDMRQRYLKAYNNTNDVNVLFDVTIKAWDRFRVHSSLQKLNRQLKSSSSDILTSNSTIAILSEIMFNPSLLIDRSISSLYADLFLSIPQNILEQMCRGFLPGMIIVSVHENDNFRQLFWKIMQGFPLENSVKLEDFNAHGYSGPMQSVIRRLEDWNSKCSHFQEYPYTKNLKLYWKGLRRILCCLDSSTIVNGLCEEPIKICNLVISTINNQEQQESVFVEVMKCFQALLKKIKIGFWNSASVSAQDLMNYIFSSSIFRKTVESLPKKRKHLLGWVTELIESSVNVSPTLFEYLLYSFQRTSWPSEFALESLDLALKILKRHNLKIDSTLGLKLKSVVTNEKKEFIDVLLGSRRLSFINEILSLNVAPASNDSSVPFNNGILSHSTVLDTPITSKSSSKSNNYQIPVNPEPPAFEKKPQSTVFKPSNTRMPISMNTSSKTLPTKKGTIGKMRDKFIKENQAKHKERQDMMRHASTSKISNRRLNSITGTSSAFEERSQPKPPEQPRRTKLLDFNEVISHHKALQNNKQKDRIVQIRRKEDNMKRLRPNLKSLHKQVLTWNVNSMGDIPPNILKNNYKHIPDKFQTVEEYISVFEPLLILEIWQSFISAKEEIDDSGDSYVVVIDGSVSIDDFIEVECHSVDNGQLKNLSENDLVMMKSVNNGEGFFKRSKIFLAIVKSVYSSKLNMHCYFNDDPHNIRGELRPRSSWTVEKVISLTPAAREYAALMASPYYKFINLIMQPNYPKISKCPKAQLERLINVYQINESQAEAVWKVLQNKDNISLIQGPPGTGKTSTIVSIISELRSISATYKPRILACAPSNAAVDEIEKRLRDGIYDSNGNLEKVVVARFGKFEHVINEETSNLKIRMATLSQEINEKKRRRQDPRISGWDAETLDAQVSQINEEIEEIRKTLRDSEDNKNEKSRRINKELLEADIICATLTGSGHDMLADFTFQAVIIDEAAQAIELTSLIPMKFNPSWCVLVGDSNQLPPTVLSRVATDFFYEQSLFSRIQRSAPDSVHMLKIQYRMHPEICRFPSQLFYGSELQDAMGLEQLRTQRWHVKRIFSPYRFFDVLGIMGQDQNSFYNREEAITAVKLIETLIMDFPEIDFRNRIGVITPYKRQLAEIKRLFIQKIPTDLYRGMEFNTVDGFQGKEKDIIIFSCVRAGRESSVGFLKDIRRMNVALTRAKSSLFILGNRFTLEKNSHWKELIENAIQRGLYIRCSGYQFAMELDAEVGRAASNEVMIVPSVSFRDARNNTQENSIGYNAQENSVGYNTQENSNGWDIQENSVWETEENLIGNQPINLGSGGRGHNFGRGSRHKRNYSGRGRGTYRGNNKRKNENKRFKR